MKVQDVVRSMSWVEWNRGYSKCYRDTGYTRTKRTVRFKFEYLTTDITPVDRAYAAYEIELAAALEAAGHPVVQVQVLNGFVCIWQAFPIQIVEQAAA